MKDVLRLMIVVGTMYTYHTEVGLGLLGVGLVSSARLRGGRLGGDEGQRPLDCLGDGRRGGQVVSYGHEPLHTSGVLQADGLALRGRVAVGPLHTDRLGLRPGVQQLTGLLSVNTILCVIPEHNGIVRINKYLR